MNLPDRISIVFLPRKGLRYLVPAVVLLLLFGCWYAARPKTYRLVGKYSIKGNFNSCLATDAGFLLPEDPDRLVLRDWKTGRLRWQVRTAPPDLKGWLSKRDEPYVGISPNGRFLVAVTAAGKQARYQCWQDGRLVGEMFLTVPQKLAISPVTEVKTHLTHIEIFTCDTGRSFVVLWIHPANKKIKGLTSYIYAVEHNRVVASDVLPQRISFSPDGATIAIQSTTTKNIARGTRIVKETSKRDTVASVSITGGRISYSHKFALPAKACLALKGTAIAKSKIYPTSLAPELLACPYEFQWISQNGRYGLFYYYNYSDNKSYFLLVDLVTGKIRRTSHAGSFRMGYPTNDGNAFVCQVEYGPYDSQVGSALLKIIPPLFYTFLHQRHYLVCYHRSGRVMARLSIDQPESMNDFFSSPDGRSIALVMSAQDDECLLYRF